MNAEIRITGDDLQKKLAQLTDEEIGRMLYAGANEIKNHIQQEITEQGLVDTGAFRSGIHIGRRVGNSITVGDSVKYGVYLEYGTRPHVISARFKPTLSWKDRKTGQWIHAKRVHHPGTRAYRVFTNALIKSQADVLQSMQAVVMAR
jgi:hypothetical protein